MENRHTPGPWKWDSKGSLVTEFKGKSYRTEILNQLGEGTICTDEDEALIAAAPELLEALESVAHAINETDGPTREDMQLIYKAIKKAKGEA